MANAGQPPIVQPYDLPELWIDGIADAEVSGGSTIRFYLYAVERLRGHSTACEERRIKIAIRAPIDALPSIMHQMRDAVLATTEGAIGRSASMLS